ncbi:putative deoxyhypusine synthase [Halotydeus destructor]|nr:putative deoxyhypusine synthase [Halotydeus destructor]
MTERGNASGVPDVAVNSVLIKSTVDPELTSAPKVVGYDFNSGINYTDLLKSYHTCGFQATNLANAIKQIEAMLGARKEQFEEDVHEEDEFIKRKSSCTLFLGYTSNMVSSGLRETIRFLVEHKLVDCLVTSAGGVEEDIIKCLGPTLVGSFELDGRTLRSKGINRIGNLLVPNDNYCAFEDWVMPVLNRLLDQQKKGGVTWTPSKVIEQLGHAIDDKSSILYWAAKNQIPIFCPALTDGSLGDMLYMHSFRNPGLVIDIVQDIRRLNSMAVKAQKTGVIILGGGLVKHHINNANLMRNGADYAVYVNTGNEFDGSDSGARPDEAISWGKIRTEARPVKVYCDATLVFPLIVAETFAKEHFKKNQS